MGLEKETSR